MNPEVSVIIPCFNEEKFIARLIEGLLEQDLPREEHELIFVDGMSNDRTREILRSYTERYDHIRLLDNEAQHVPQAMNKGITEAKGRIIVRLDAHADYPKNYLSYLVGKLKETGADNVGVPWKTRTLSSNPKARAIQKVLAHPLGVGNSHFRVGVNEAQEVDTVPFGCYWKETLQKVGGYNNALHRNQDIELNKRLLRQGGRILLLPDISLTYYARENYKELARNNYRNGLWNIRTIYITRDSGSLSLRHFIPLIFVLSLILPTIAAFFIPLAGLLPLLILGIYTLAILIVSIRTKDEHSSLTHMILSFFTLHFSYGIGSLVGLLRIDDLFRSN